MKAELLKKLSEKADFTPPPAPNFDQHTFGFYNNKGLKKLFRAPTTQNFNFRFSLFLRGFQEMSKWKRKRGFFDFFGFDDEDFLFGREPVEGGSGYSISVTYDESGKPLVHVKTHGDVDAEELRRNIEQRYPGAKIEGLEKNH